VRNYASCVEMQIVSAMSGAYMLAVAEPRHAGLCCGNIRGVHYKTMTSIYARLASPCSQTSLAACHWQG